MMTRTTRMTLLMKDSIWKVPAATVVVVVFYFSDMGETVTYCHRYQITGAQMTPQAIDGLQVTNETIGRHGMERDNIDINNQHYSQEIKTV